MLLNACLASRDITTAVPLFCSCYFSSNVTAMAERQILIAAAIALFTATVSGVLGAQLADSKYDFGTTIFSPQGRLYQVEYASEVREALHQLSSLHVSGLVCGVNYYITVVWHSGNSMLGSLVSCTPCGRSCTPKEPLLSLRDGVQMLCRCIDVDQVSSFSQVVLDMI